MTIFNILISLTGIIVLLAGLIYDYLMMRQGSSLAKKIAITKIYIDNGMDDDTALRKAGATNDEYNRHFWKIW